MKDIGILSFISLLSFILVILKLIILSIPKKCYKKNQKKNYQY